MSNQPADDPVQRRPIKSRNSWWAQRAVSLVLRTSITPNGISLISIGCAVIAACGFLLAGAEDSYWLLAAIMGIQLRLLCNLLDGMVAVEGGRATADGPLYNELPDRIADVVILLGVGYGSRDVGFPLDPIILGWCAAVLAVGTAYVRALGGALGAGECFLGPMAKPHRMALLTGVALFELIRASIFHSPGKPLFPFTLVVIIIGCTVTICRRIAAIRRALVAPR